MKKRSQRSMYRVLLTVAVVALAAVGASTARADSGTPPAPTSQLVDTSHQVTDIQKQIAQMQAKGQAARSGKLAAAATCGFQNASQVFAPWGDLAGYALAPQGDLATTSGWTFKHTTLAADHDPFTAATSSLLFAQGDSEAISPAMCVDLSNPTMRLFLKDTGGNGKSDIKVDVLYEGLDGNIQHLTLAKLRVGSRLGTVDHDPDRGQHPLHSQRQRPHRDRVRLQGRRTPEERDTLARRLLRRSVQKPLDPLPPCPSKSEKPRFRGFFVKRMKRLELSTFCMASRRSSQLSYIRQSPQ